MTRDTGGDASREPPLAQVCADVDALRQERDRLRREVTHLLEVTSVWRAERDRLRAEVAALRRLTRRDPVQTDLPRRSEKNLFNYNNLALKAKFKSAKLLESESKSAWRIRARLPVHGPEVPASASLR